MARLRLLLLTMVVTAFAGVAHAEGRHALVISVDKYQAMRPLKNAVNDGRAVRDALEALGFEVRLVSDKDLRTVRRELSRFREYADGAEVALVFFSGHGVEIGGENRLLTADSEGASLDLLERTSLPLEEVRDIVADAGEIGLILLDACRNDPLGSGGVDGRGATVLAVGGRLAKPGLTRAPGRAGKAGRVLFAFSASPGETASDGSGDNSPFSAALAKYLPADGLEIRSVFTLVQQEVYDRTRGGQLPYVESGLPTTFFAASASDVLPERERLLLAMADVSGDVRALAETVAAEFDVPLAPLYGSLLSRQAAPGLPQAPAMLLREAAERYVAMRRQIGMLSQSDPSVATLRREAEEAVSLGSFETAAAKLEEASAVDRRSIENLRQNTLERQRSYGASLTLLGGVRESQADFAEAYRVYREAHGVYAEIGADALAPGDYVSLWEANNGIQNAVKSALLAQMELSLEELQVTILQRRVELEATENEARRAEGQAVAAGPTELAQELGAAEARLANLVAAGKGVAGAVFPPQDATLALTRALCVARLRSMVEPDDVGWQMRLVYSLMTSVSFGPGGRQEADEARAILSRLAAAGKVPASQADLMTSVLTQAAAVPVSMAEMIGVQRPDYRAGCDAAALFGR